VTAEAKLDGNYLISTLRTPTPAQIALAYEASWNRS
jgi:hypothetical protein